MTGNGVCFAVAETDAGDQGGLARWRDDSLVPGIGGITSVRRLERYMAFNVKRCALVSNTGEVPDMQPVVYANADIRSEILNGRKVSEFAQAGESRAIESAPILYSVRFSVPPGAIDSPELRAARSTSGRAQFAAQDWFKGFDKMFYFRQAPS